jgi:hypothetical protein
MKGAFLLAIYMRNTTAKQHSDVNGFLVNLYVKNVLFIDMESQGCKVEMNKIYHNYK